MKLVAPVIASVPLSVIALPLLLKLAAPLIVEAPRSRAAFSVTDTSEPVMDSVPKVEDAWSSVRFAVPESKLVAPVIASVPLSVIALFELLKLAVPLIVEVPRSRTAFSVTDTSAPVMDSVPKVEDTWSSVRFAVPELKVVAPVIASVPLSVIALFVLLKLAVPLIVETPRSRAAFSVTATFAPVIDKVPKVDNA